MKTVRVDQEHTAPARVVGVIAIRTAAKKTILGTDKSTLEGMTDMYKTIKKLFLSCALVCASSASAAWYEGGTLHQKSVSEWAVATQENKLATSGDFAAGAKLSTNIDELKVWAGAIMSCIDEVATDPSSHSQEVTMIAALCILVLKEQ